MYYIKSTHINDDHLDLADDEHAVSQGLRHENVAVVHVDRVPPAAVDALVAAHVLLQISLAIAITNGSSVDIYTRIFSAFCIMRKIDKKTQAPILQCFETDRNERGASFVAVVDCIPLEM